MELTSEQLVKDISKVNVEDILSCWQWRLSGMKAVITVSCMGDVFLLGDDDAVYWLQTGWGELTKVADELQQYEQFLTQQEKIGNWFRPVLVEKLLTAGKALQESEVYSCKVPPSIGGEYSVDNIEAVDMSAHFGFTGQICQQIKDLPSGTPVKIQYVDPK
ncbi:MAG: T6SS immunity protein Tdi1 domain-containing protein [Chitinophagaceae bacterium]